MIGIYKITNKNNGKSYIGQSIHCGKRLDEHCKGDQFIDSIIQLEGIQNFNFEVLKEINGEELSYWEDYYIMKYDTMFPNGYNKKWNCSKQVREDISIKLITDNSCIYFPVEEKILKNIKYSDSIYAWLCLHSNYSQKNQYSYIDCSDINYQKIGEELGKTRQTISKRIKILLDSLLIEKNNQYIFKDLPEYQEIDKQTIKVLLKLYQEKPTREELIKTYIWLRKKNKDGQKEFSYTEIIEAFGHTKGNKQVYERFKDILTTLQGAGLIKFRTDVIRLNKGQYGKTLYIYQVNKKASQEWLDKNTKE